MRYRVAFSKRVQTDGTESAWDPTAELDVNLPEGSVAEKVFVERLEPAAQHGQEVLDEDDDFLGAVTAEAWEYEVVVGREQEFEDAMRDSEAVLNYEVIDDSDVGEEDATGVAFRDGDALAPEPAQEAAGDDGELEGLRVAMADDPTLGLTNRGVREARDWAANTGPSREADRGIESDFATDKGSTLAPDRTRRRTRRR